MSIFKETLDPGIQTQLKARTLVVSGENNNRSGLLPWYLSKNAWVRMTSFVNFTEGIVIPNGKGSVIVDPLPGHYKEDQLSKKYILEGGTLYTEPTGNDTFGSLRYGVATPNAVYGGNIDSRPNGTADPKYFRQLGLRPMPGITDVSLRTIGAYGSLFETTVKFHAWDTNQLNELEILFMRPGYSVLLEWGWSQYINYNDDKVNAKNTLTQEQVFPSVFNGQTINTFDPNLTPEDVYANLEVLRKKYKYNYDGMLGYIKNFDWKLRKDGGYDCSTTLISMGEVINTLKMSNNSNKTTENVSFNPEASTRYVYDDFENVLISLKSDAELYDSPTFGENTTLDAEYRAAWNYDLNYVTKKTIKQKLDKLKYIKQRNELNKQPYLQDLKEGSDDDHWIYGRYYEYLTLDVLIAIISSFSNVRAKNNSKEYQTVTIIPPDDNDYCLAGRDSISVNPSVCNVLNKGAFEKEIQVFAFENGHETKGLGIYPEITDISRNKITNDLQFYDNTIKAGRMNRILVNIDLLLNVYKDMKQNTNESGVIMVNYLKNILNKISNALGGLNNFTLSTAGRDQNTLRIIDTYYFGQEKFSKDYTYQFDLFGLGSICKDVSIQSKIFQEQSTIVAIAAQSKANLGDVYNSTQVYLNAGLKDRLAEAKWQGNEDEITKAPDVFGEAFKINATNDFYKKLVNLMLYARDYLIGRDNTYSVIPGQDNGSGHTLLKQALLRYDGELNFKALIPFKLRITLEGIGGIVVGQIFTVKQNILPKNYYDKKLGFIVTQIEHSLNNNQWETTLDTQICILDQQNFYDANGNPLLTVDIKREGFGDFVAIQALKGILWPILIDFLVYQLTRSYIGFTYTSNGEKGADAWRKLLYEGKAYQENIDQYWKGTNENNINAFVGISKDALGGKFILNPNGYSKVYYLKGSETLSGTGNNITNYYGFKNFALAWIETWELQNSNKLDQNWSSELKVRDAIDFMKKVLIGEAREETIEEYKGFSENVQAIVAWLNELKNSTFYPEIKDPNSLWNFDDGSGLKPTFTGDYSILATERINKTEITPATTKTISEYSIKGWNKNNLQSKLDQLANSDSTIKDIKKTYNAGIKVGGTNNKVELRTLFLPYSTVMYGASNSLILNKPLGEPTSGILKTFGFEIPKLISEDPYNNQYNDEIWINTIFRENPNIQYDGIPLEKNSDFNLNPGINYYRKSELVITESNK